MKKILSIFTTIMLFMTLTACNNNTGENNDSSNESSTATTSPKVQSSNALIIYFSYSGNTKKVAQTIAKDTGSDLFEIVPIFSVYSS